ncbi:adenylyltransferase/cytidyltransferase family protein [Phormidium sp. CCY1219]|uniref:adenylyltransferase/cytidyltransferase family protein n=1 Tax=Phormidium sp. CCY1219 TaxID=2886104 RepID=UPI002D1F845F|nr:adenylyltransferase/cytidyltransferase family protein [Phormidium sp. CCY1219]MEB3827254.1 adenylyltransferase/cytidyltransferase family protein [Phormidium sp. CCY1219]
MISGIYTIDALQEKIATDRDRWRPLVFTNGCFDLLHVGHVRYLQKAKALGRALVVGLNSDRSVQTIKPTKPGQPPRPIVPQMQRAEVLCALKPVDGVIIFDGTTAAPLIEAVQPDIYVKGGDWTVETLPEAPTVQAYGGRIELCKIEVPTSTTGIILSILNS